MIFICLTPNPKGEHLKIIELGFFKLLMFSGFTTVKELQL